ncbi:MAG: aminotransferase class V-fold PLP-dependent enzyme [Kordiimonadaceae bacterium]|nr:aminotransferase class V-fold PLP-dependent enzyme [Kordiimonadaceae bacterium]MBT6037288.1 aminotransferase class V-fold PLP-dependent enzyme [Kordiimonadaceae bacterium]MBT6329211.1 aminotransferase class V-fold PLP-dependent enzyme [Kordiimonadaceae bacterium]
MIKCQKELFDIPQDITYLNAAYMGPLMKTAADIGAEAVRKKLKPWGIPISDFFGPPNRYYELAAEMIGSNASDIAIVPSVSYGTAIAAKNIKVSAGQNFVIMADQFPSNVYPWIELAEENGAEIITVDWPDDGDWTAAIIAAIDENTAIVASANAHWTNGTLIDLVAVGRSAREVGAALVLDLTQTLGVTPFSVKDVDPDYMIVGSYKWLLGPYSLGFMYVAPRNQGGKPIEESWITRKGAEDFARLVDYKEEYEAGARRFDMGEKSNFINIPIAIAAMEKLNELGVENIAEYIKSLTDYIAERACAIGLNVADENMRVPNLIGINFKDGVPSHIAGKLAENKIFVSIRGDSIRVAPHIYNEKADVDRLFDVLESEL